MGLQSAMTTALTGLQAAETTIDIVGNNVANSNTVGFKESNAIFATQFLQTQSIGSAPSVSSGGTNPRQTGLGVKVAAINPDFTQGTIEISSNPLDVAIQGDGFLMVQGGQGERLYTRNGQLQTNANNEVVTATGNRVLGYGVDDQFNIVENLETIKIPLGQETVAQATTTAIFAGVLSPTAEIGTLPSIIQSQAMGDSSNEFPDDVAFDLSKFTVITSPVVSTTTAAVAAGSVPNGDYQYRVTFYKNSGATTVEGAPSLPFGNITLSGGGEDIALTNLPADNSGDWDGRRLYRSDNGGTFNLVHDFNETLATGYTDTAVSASGTALDADSLGQANYSYYVTFVDTAHPDVESRPTDMIGSIAISDVNRRIRIDDIPQPDPLLNQFNAVRIYRNTKGSPADFHLVETLPTGQSTYIDNAPDSAIVGNQSIDLIGPKAQTTTALKDVVIRDGDTYIKPFSAGTLSFEGKKGDRALAAKTLTITDSTTVGELTEFMTQAFGINTVAADNPTGTSPGGVINDGIMQFTSNMGIANQLSVPLSAFRFTPTGSSNATPVPLRFSETQPIVNGAGSTSDFLVYDTLGIPVNVRITTVMEEKTPNSRTYRWYATSKDNEPDSGVGTSLGSGKITFDSFGQIIGGAFDTIAIDRRVTGSQSPLEFSLDFSRVSGLSVQNNFGTADSTMSMTQQDGFAPGSLASFIITESGLIRGVFTNGTERPLGQIRMARFSNSAGLQQVGENVFSKGVNSGEPIEGDPGDSGLGSLTAGATELSNTDIGQNLIELILASTQYRGGTRVITAAQQLLDELMALRR